MFSVKSHTGNTQIKNNVSIYIYTVWYTVYAYITNIYIYIWKGKRRG